jgi:hypothetical protein
MIGEVKPAGSVARSKLNITDLDSILQGTLGIDEMALDDIICWLELLEFRVIGFTKYVLGYC